MVLDQDKLEHLMQELNENLSSEDVFEIKKKLQSLDKNGRLLP